MAGFEYRGQLNGAENPVTTHEIIEDSATVKVGDAITMNNGFAKRATANVRIFGICVGLVDKQGIDLDNTNSSNLDGTYTSSSQTYVAASDNETDKQIKAIIIADEYSLWFNDASGSLTSAMNKEHFSLSDQDQVDAGTNSATVGEMQLWKRDPDGDADASKGLFHIVSWQGDSFEPET